MHLGLGLLPIVPILLLPFIFVFFVIVFPLWGVTLAVLGTLLLLIRGVDWLARRAGVSAFSGASRAIVCRVSVGSDIWRSLESAERQR